MTPSPRLTVVLELPDYHLTSGEKRQKVIKALTSGGGWLKGPVCLRHTHLYYVFAVLLRELRNRLELKLLLLSVSSLS